MSVTLFNHISEPGWPLMSMCVSRLHCSSDVFTQSKTHFVLLTCNDNDVQVMPIRQELSQGMPLIVILCCDNLELWDFWLHIVWDSYDLVALSFLILYV